MHPRRHTLAIGILATLIGTAAHAETSDAQMRLVEQGQYWQARDNAARASEAWEKVLRLDPNQIDALYGMGLIGVKQDKPRTGAAVSGAVAGVVAATLAGCAA